MPKVFTIPYGIPYLDNLAQGILARYGHDPLRFSEILLLLPNRRSCRLMQEALLRQNQDKPMVLPRIEPLGEMDEDILLLHQAFREENAPTPIAPQEEHLLLTRLVWQWNAARKEKFSYGQAAELARELARLWNDMEREGATFTQLSQLVPSHFAAHWQLSLEFLTLLSEHWPKILREQGKTSAAQYRNHTLAYLAKTWQQNPPHTPIIAAGSTGSIAATRHLLRAIASLPEGHVVLPGVDIYLEEEAWDVLEPSHPHYGIKRLLETLGTDRHTIPSWHEADIPAHLHARSKVLSETLRPASTTHAWEHIAHGPFREGMQAVSLHETTTVREEALLIAMQMREVLETPGKRAMLVTHDRTLARYTTNFLRKWGITLDSAIGQPLASSHGYQLLMAVKEVTESNASPVPLLTLLKHPLVTMGQIQNRHLVSQLEMHMLRGVRQEEGLKGILAALGKLADKEVSTALHAYVAQLAEYLEPLFSLYRQKQCAFPTLLNTHLAVCEKLAASNTLWSGAQEQALFTHLNAIATNAALLGDIPPQEYGALLVSLLKTALVPPGFVPEPRLLLSTPMEARLVHVDKIFLGGLNEGSWPPQTTTSAWLNRAMEQQLGLPPPEQKTGMSAHDFFSLCHMKEVVFTRARKVDGKPAQASRWLLRLQAVLGNGSLTDTTPWHHWMASLYAPQRFTPIAPPAPTPPVAARPRELSVTQIEKWMRDPYSIYASEILRLKKLDPVDEDPGAAEFGNFIHAVIDNFLRHYTDIPADDRLPWMLEEGKKWIKRKAVPHAVQAFWWPRFERITAWFVVQEEVQRQKGTVILAECKGRYEIEAPAGMFTLKARADRMEYNTQHHITLIDYKTGSVPEKGDIALGLSPQMALEGVMAEAGAFDHIAGKTEKLTYWRLTGNEPAGDIENISNPERLVSEANDGLSALIRAFDLLATPYHAEPWPEKAPRYNDYRHLARVEEWHNI